jgi:hypothetical protein
MSWDAAGAFVWHPDAIDPAALGSELRANGFGWAAVFIQDGSSAAALDPAWIARFRQASGLPLGGWGALRADAAGTARIADEQIHRYGLDFYVADAEAEYGYTGPTGKSGARFSRSQAFVGEFRRLEPALPAAIASYCRPDQHDLDWKAWSAAGFDFLPEAYVNELGAAVDPASCVAGASAWFPAARVHPIVGMYQGSLGLGSAADYARLLQAAGTTGFSVYLAEQGMSGAKWAAFGQAIEKLGIAARPRHV